MVPEPLPPLCGANWPPFLSGSVTVGVGLPLVSYIPAASSKCSVGLFHEKPTRLIHLFERRLVMPTSMPLY
jgi:hypothetical protein